MKRLILGIAIIFTITSCKSEVKNENTEAQTIKELKQETKTLFIELSPKNNSIVNGKAKFEETNGVIEMTVVVNGLSEGIHAIHIHEKSDCASVVFIQKTNVQSVLSVMLFEQLAPPSAKVKYPLELWVIPLLSNVKSLSLPLKSFHAVPLPE